jgi:hypothetical protein
MIKCAVCDKELPEEEAVTLMMNGEAFIGHEECITDLMFNTPLKRKDKHN